MFLKQYNYKPRTGSGSEGSSAVDTSPSSSDQSLASSTAAAGRRRSSAADKFAGLTAHKRASQDGGIDAKKASFAEQKPGSGGVLGNMWQSFTKGT